MINASIHFGGLIKKLAAQEEINILFLPPYCPELAAVETVFAVIKAKVKGNISKIK